MAANNSTSESTTNSNVTSASDHPGLALVSQLLTSENYSTWSRSIIMALTAKNKLGFIDGTIKRVVDPSDTSYLPWKRCNTMVFSWLLNSVSKEIAGSIIYAESVHDIWEDLKEEFGKIGERYERMR
ncbi:hypothetical protein L1049_027850 [Liquidambar formosana]|uniref:Retrotransposon Copia-like N-terminal domain-containing protein n=1 Tax=Liquidambar formosana TaxID=63359 RepID=A0AAP0RJW0_LIQFO